MNLIDTAYLLARFDISEDVLAARLEKNIGAASRRLRRWAGEELYQTILAASEGEDRREDFKFAEANLAMHFAVLGLNTPITSKGIIKATRGKDSSVITYFTPEEIRAVQQLYLEQAEEIIRPYLALDDVATLALTEVGGNEPLSSPSVY